MIWLGIVIGLAIGIVGYYFFPLLTSKARSAEKVLKADFDHYVADLYARITAVEKHLGL